MSKILSTNDGKAFLNMFMILGALGLLRMFTAVIVDSLTSMSTEMYELGFRIVVGIIMVILTLVTFERIWLKSVVLLFWVISIALIL